MINLKEKIQNYFNQNNAFIKAEELKKKLGVKGEEQTDLFYSALELLVEEGSLFFDTKKGYKLFTNELGFAYGEIEINKAGNGFIHTKDGYTIFIENSDLNGALDGDKVIISSIDFGRRDDFKGEVYKVIKRKTGNVIFEVIGNGYDASLVPYNKNEIVPILINKNELKNLVDGEYVLVNVGTQKQNDEFLATIKKVIGHRSDPNIDIKMIYTKHNIPTEFSEEALKEAEQLPTCVTLEDMKGKKDLRNIDFITIDCDDTKDRDDAVYAEMLPNGNIKLFVAISLIDYYVKKGTKLYEEALEKCNSFYPGGTCNPMFPHKLSNGICSLNENVDRLARVTEMEINPHGEIVDYDIYEAVINSRKAMKYSDCNKIFNCQSVSGYEEFVPQLMVHKKLNSYLEKARRRRGCIDFALNEIEKKVDDENNIVGFEARGLGLAGRIIENEMLVTGTTIAGHYSWLPFMYRIQEEPNPMTLKNVIKTLRLSGLDIPKFENASKECFNSILAKIKNREEADIIRTMLLRSTKRASYSTLNVGHFALQLNNYCHFTAPIRRITDFMIHSLISELNTLDYSPEKIKELEQEFENICVRASESERKAQMIEDEVMAMEMAEYMEKHIGEEFDSIVTEVYPHGMFVKTTGHITGKIKFENMHDDKYKYNYEKRAIIGSSTKKKYQIGNKVCVVVKDACKETRTINFEIGKQKSLRK